MSGLRGHNFAGKNHAPREVPCRKRCGAVLIRSSYFHLALCDDCKKIQRLGEDDLRRHQARRYRILLHVMGYEDSQFDELVSDLKASDLCLRSKPVGRAAKVDVRIDKRNRKAGERANRRRSPCLAGSI